MNQKQNTVCIIGVYFGNLPKYFDLWKLSAEYNKAIDYLIVTDQQLDQLPVNIRVLKMSLEQMEAMAAEKLNIPTLSIKKPYKCCDFRPVYGVIFRDYIKEYEYWGHCDFDMIFGDIIGFLEKNNYRSYDKFLTLGHLTLYRNTEENNSRYRCSGSRVDYKTVFTTDNNYAFDEVTGITQIYSKNGFPQFTKRIFCDIASVYYRFRDIEEYSLDIKAINHHNQIYYWRNGHIYRQWFDKKGGHVDEYIYIHFKKRPNFEVNFVPDAGKGFYITNKGFFLLNSEPDISIAKKYNKYHPLKEFKETVAYKLKPYTNRIKKLVGMHFEK